MKSVILLSMVAAIAVANTGYDIDLKGFKVEDAAADKEYLKSFLYCFIDESPCTGVAVELKKNAHDSAQTACAKCSDEQKHLVHGFLVAFEKELPEDYEKFKKVFDPNGNLLPATLAATADY